MPRFTEGRRAAIEHAWLAALNLDVAVRQIDHGWMVARMLQPIPPPLEHAWRHTRRSLPNSTIEDVARSLRISALQLIPDDLQPALHDNLMMAADAYRIAAQAAMRVLERT